MGAPASIFVRNRPEGPRFGRCHAVRADREAAEQIGESGIEATSGGHAQRVGSNRGSHGQQEDKNDQAAEAHGGTLILSNGFQGPPGPWQVQGRALALLPLRPCRQPNPKNLVIPLIGGAAFSRARSGTGRAVRASPASSASSSAATAEHERVAAARADDLQAERHAVAIGAHRQATAGWPASVTA